MPTLSQRQVHWLKKLVEFDFSFQPFKGKSNDVADALSRYPKYAEKPELLNFSLLHEAAFQTSKVNVVSQLIDVSKKDMRAFINGYLNDKSFKNLCKCP